MVKRLNNKYSKKYISEILQGYSALRIKNKRTWKINMVRLRKIDDLINIINAKKNESILDIGCGFGIFLDKCAQFGADCYGIDIDEDIVKSVSKYFSQNNYSGKINFCQSSAEKLPYKANFFNKVLVIDILEHVSDLSKELIFKEIRRVLKRNGLLIINTPNKIYLQIRMYFKRILAVLKLKNPYNEKIPHTPGSYEGLGEHIGLTNIFYIRKLLKMHGFSIENIYYHPETKLDKYFFNFYSKIPFIRDIFVGSITMKAIKN